MVVCCSHCADVLHDCHSQRLGCMKGGFKELKSHVWFDGFDWEVMTARIACSLGCRAAHYAAIVCCWEQALVAMRIPPPLIPKFSSPMDISLFEEITDSSLGRIVPYA